MVTERFLAGSLKKEPAETGHRQKVSGWLPNYFVTLHQVFITYYCRKIVSHSGRN
jgi:hypothetical protein